jgi:hypothetical protein
MIVEIRYHNLVNRGPENRDYEYFTEQLAQQFADGENVDTGNLTYLRDFSDDSRRHYDLLMNRVADLHNIESFDTAQETRVRGLGSSAVSQC